MLYKITERVLSVLLFCVKLSLLYVNGESQDPRIKSQECLRAGFILTLVSCFLIQRSIISPSDPKCGSRHGVGAASQLQDG